MIRPALTPSTNCHLSVRHYCNSRRETLGSFGAQIGQDAAQDLNPCLVAKRAIGQAFLCAVDVVGGPQDYSAKITVVAMRRAGHQCDFEPLIAHVEGDYHPPHLGIELYTIKRLGIDMTPKAVGNP